MSGRTGEQEQWTDSRLISTLRCGGVIIVVTPAKAFPLFECELETSLKPSQERASTAWQVFQVSGFVSVHG